MPNKSPATGVAPLVIAGAMLLAATAADASLIGTTVMCDIQANTAPSPWACSADTAEVSNGDPEFTLNLNGEVRFGVNISDQTITLEMLSQGANLSDGEVLTLSNLVWTDVPTAEINGIKHFTTTSTTGFPGAFGFDITDIATGPHSIALILDGSSWAFQDTASIVLDVPHDVPEPGTLALLGLGLAGLRFARRRKAT